MKGQNLFIIVILAILLFAAIFVINQPKSFKPDATVTLDKANININDNKLSELITATITRNDNENISTIFSIRFSDTTDAIYVTDVDGKRIYELTTRPLKDSGAKDILQFKVFGTKKDYSEAKRNIKIELWWNGTIIENKYQSLEVNVK